MQFNDLALQLYRYQLKNNVILQKYVELTKGDPSPKALNHLRFLPVSFFKQQEVKTGDYIPVTTFISSSTTSQIPSQHHVRDLSIYEQSFLTQFERVYGSAEQYIFLCLLPGYLERSGSSLVYMAKGLIEASNHVDSGFYLYDFESLHQKIMSLQNSTRKIFLLGVTFALLDFVEQYPEGLGDAVIMETGGMKGRKTELTRKEIHDMVSSTTKNPIIHSEYGMSEMLSQAYAASGGIFEPAPWLQIIITDINDPFQPIPNGKTGLVNIIDLANIDSCAFLQTQDIGKVYNDGKFEILGRLDHSEIRGCNLLYI
jgi:hypothetical protein